MSASTPPSSSAANPSDDDDKDEHADSSPPSASESDEDVPPPPLDYSALAARIAELQEVDNVTSSNVIHSIETVDSEEAAGYIAAYHSAVSLFLLLVGDRRGSDRGRGSSTGGGVGGGAVYNLPIGRDRVALVFATRNDAVLYGRIVLTKWGGVQERRVRVAELLPDDAERLCESGGMRMGFVPPGALTHIQGGLLAELEGEDGNGGDDDVLADGGMDKKVAAALRAMLNKLYKTDGRRS
ncbi:hypothetical protein MMPV_006801 [Pyropia vietnamensis]